MLSFFPLDVLGEIWDLIESVSESFPTYSNMLFHLSFIKKKLKAVTNEEVRRFCNMFFLFPCNLWLNIESTLSRFVMVHAFQNPVI